MDQGGEGQSKRSYPISEPISRRYKLKPNKDALKSDPRQAIVFDKLEIYLEKNLR